MNSLISIIVPHYNTPDSLLRLIKSIPVRDDIEVLVVDDNSDIPDMTFGELRLKLSEFPHVQLFLNDSGVKGAGASRNVALRKAVGKWILFADADDFFLEGLYDKLLPYLESDYDMVYFPPTSMDEATGNVSSRHLYYMDLVNSYYDKPSLKTLTALRFGFCTPWSKLVRRSIFYENNISFDEIMASNDIMCITKCAFYSHNIKASDETIYCVVRGANTLTAAKNEKRFDTRIDVLVRRYCFLRDNLPKKEFKYTHIDRLALGRLVEVIADRWGIKKLFEVLRLYQKNKVRFFDIGLLNPVTLLYSAKKQLDWIMEIRKHR